MHRQPDVVIPPPTEPFQKQSAAAGIAVVAAVMLLLASAGSILQGTVALADDELYVAGVDYVYAFDTTTWGWIHVILGTVGVICAFGLMFGTTWGRYAAIGIAALVIVANFLSLPHYPAWSTLVIAFSVAVIWAATTWRPTKSA
ncbi:DUF7144 family membrane protein [Nocardia takedensis]